MPHKFSMTNKVFLAYDEDMMLHRPNHNNLHLHNENMLQRPSIETVGDPNFVFERPSRLRAAHDALIDLEQRLLQMNQQQNQDNNNNNTGIGHQKDHANDDSMPVDAIVHGHRFIPLACHPASREAICRVHSQKHYDFMESTSFMSPKDLDRLTEESSDLYFCENTFYAARLAVGGCIHAVNAVTAPMHISRRAICLVRPPAHHATRDVAMGFCYFNSIVIAAQHALHTGRASKVFILDWDIHHGNGIQDLTYNDPNIFYLSIHRASSTKQWFYPDTGRPEETGDGCGIGTNANIALKRGGMGNKEYAAAFCELVLPAMEDFQPDLILIACGADAAKGDLLGDFGLTSDMYYLLTKSLLLTAGIDIPVIAILEGGYNLPVIADCIQAVAIAMLNEPFEGTFVSSQSLHVTKSAHSVQEQTQANETVDCDENDGSWPLSRLWNPAEKAELLTVRNNHPEKGVTKQALLAIKRTAHALAASQSRCSQSTDPRSVGIDRVSNSLMVPNVRRMRLLDYDRCPAKHCRR